MSSLVYTPDELAAILRIVTYDAATGLVPTTWTGTPDSVLDLIRSGVHYTEPALAIDNVDTEDLEINASFAYAIAEMGYIGTAAAGLALPAGTVPNAKWAVWLVSIDDADAKTVTAGANNYTTGYDDAAAALAAIPATPAGEFPVGVLVVQAQADPAGFVAATNDIDGAETQSYVIYPLKSADGDALTVNVDSPVAGHHWAEINIPLAGGVIGDAIFWRATGGTVDGDAFRGDLSRIDIGDAGLTAAQLADLAANLVGGIAGTIQTLDALDTAQDSQHATTLARAMDAATKVVMDSLATENILVTAGAGPHSTAGFADSDLTGVYAVNILAGRHATFMTGALRGLRVVIVTHDAAAGDGTIAMETLSGGVLPSVPAAGVLLRIH
jgi:hypothetical protein